MRGRADSRGTQGCLLNEPLPDHTPGEQLQNQAAWPWWLGGKPQARPANHPPPPLVPTAFPTVIMHTPPT